MIPDYAFRGGSFSIALSRGNTEEFFRCANRGGSVSAYIKREFRGFRPFLNPRRPVVDRSL